MYEPKPIDTSDIEIPVEIEQLIERLAKNTHDNWAMQRLSDGWQYGKARDDENKLHPCLIDYEMLPEIEKEYDRLLAKEIIKAIIAMGYRLTNEQ